MPLSSLRRVLARPAVRRRRHGVRAGPAPGPFSSLVVFGDSLSDNGNNFAGRPVRPRARSSPATPTSPRTPTRSARLQQRPGLGERLRREARRAARAVARRRHRLRVRRRDHRTPGPGRAASRTACWRRPAVPRPPPATSPRRRALRRRRRRQQRPRGARRDRRRCRHRHARSPSAAASFAADVGSIVDPLQAAGAQHIVVWDTPNLGLAPAVVAGGGAALGSFLAASMNNALALRLAGEAGVSHVRHLRPRHGARRQPGARSASPTSPTPAARWPARTATSTPTGTASTRPRRHIAAIADAMSPSPCRCPSPRPGRCSPPAWPRSAGSSRRRRDAQRRAR